MKNILNAERGTRNAEKARRRRLAGIFLIASIAGCAVPPSALVPRPTLLSLPTPPPVTGMNFTFAYSVPLTDGYLQSSTDLVHWETRTDYVIQTNLVSGTNRLQWILPRDPARQREFYRAGGQTIL